jgi:hypothetical protein
MMNVIAQFERLYTTPNILTEVDNLSRTASPNEFSALADAFRSILSRLVETHVSAATAATVRQFGDIGLTDTTIMILASDDLLTITDDLPLASRLEGLGRAVINLNHLRFGAVV